MDTARSKITKILPGGTQAQTRAEIIKKQSRAIEEQLGFVQVLLLVFVVVAVLVGSFIIMSSFAIGVRQWIKKFALLRAIKTSSASVFSVVFLQAVVIGIVGSTLGVTASAGLLAGLPVLFDAAGMPLLEGMDLSGTIITISLAMDLAVTVVGALLPTREAVLTHLIETMRDVSGSRGRSLASRTILGELLLVIGTATVVVAWTNADLTQRGLIMGLGVGGTVLGLLIASSTLTRPIVAMPGLPFRLLRPVGCLAVHNIIYSLHRTANTPDALMIGTALVCTGTVLAASFQPLTSGEIDRSPKANLVVQPTTIGSLDTRFSVDETREIVTVDEVKETSSYSIHADSVTKPDGNQAPITTVIVINPATYSEAYDASVSAGSMKDLDATHIAAKEGKDFKLGNEVPVVNPTRSVEAMISAVVDSKGTDGNYYITLELAAAVGSWNSPGTTTGPAHVLDSSQGILLTLEEGTDLGTVQGKAHNVVVNTYQYAVHDANETSDQVGQRIDRMLIVFYDLSGLSIAIATLGIVNTLVFSVSEHTREIGLMRAVDLGKVQLSEEVVIESILASLYGTVLGETTEAVLTTTLREVLEDQGLTNLSAPWDQMVGMLVLSVVVSVITTLWPTLCASRVPILDVIAIGWAVSIK